MLRMDHIISIGETVLPVLTSVKIVKDVAKITDTATIVCPAVSHGRPLSFASRLAKWQRVKIELGYDGKLATEFEGYVQSVAFDGGEVRIECEDPLSIFRRVDMPNGEMRKPTLKQLLDRTIGEVNSYMSKEGLGGPLSVDCRYDYGYDKFTFKDCTAFHVLNKIQKEGAPNIRMRGDVLAITPQYADTDGEATYSMQRNIEKAAMNLKWRGESDRSLFVKVEGIAKDGTKTEATAGKRGENKLEIKFKTITDQKSLQAIADNILKSKIYTGYEGDFSAWLVPFCDAGYSVEIRDDKKALKSGRYFATKVEVEYSKNGGRRKVTLGAALSK